jgi:hypothetical protein
VDPKIHYMKLASDLFPRREWGSHDEAEAFLICLHGLKKECGE